MQEFRIFTVISFGVLQSTFGGYLHNISTNVQPRLLKFSKIFTQVCTFLQLCECTDHMSTLAVANSLLINSGAMYNSVPPVSIFVLLNVLIWWLIPKSVSFTLPAVSRRMLSPEVCNHIIDGIKKRLNYASLTFHVFVQDSIRMQVFQTFQNLSKKVFRCNFFQGQNFA